MNEPAPPCAPAPRITMAEHGGPAWRELVALRARVLRTPLGLAYTAEQLALEEQQLHLALWRDAVIAGGVLVVPPDEAGTARLRQMAVDPCFAGRGFGRALAGRAEAEARRFGARAMALSAREAAIGFYEKLGYRPEGACFIEVTLPHRRMVKRLARGSLSERNGLPAPVL